MTRAPELADQLRIMCRRRRADGASPPPAQREAVWAMTASAAHADLEGRLELFGSWIAEIAFAVSDKAQAAQVQAGVEMLCACEPRFRKASGRALAALDAFVRS